MTDEAGASVEAAEPVAVPEVVPSEPEITPRGAIERAFDTLDAQEAETQEAPAQAKAPETEEKPETVAEKPAERERGPDGKFIAKPAEAEVKSEAKPEDAQKVDPDKPDAAKPDEAAGQFSQAPDRFSPDAKAAWKDAPESVRAEVGRAITEMEAGIEKHRSGSEQWDTLRDFDQLARTNNTTVKGALERYVAADRQLNTDLVGGLDGIARQYGTSLQAIFAQMNGQQPDQQQTLHDQTISNLQNQVTKLSNELGGVTNNMTHQNEQRALAEIETFSKDRPRFNELTDETARQLKAGFSLQEAYERAERLNPVPVSPVVAQAAPIAEPAQPGKGSLSVTGAPSSGSNPTTKKPPSSARESIENAFDAYGL